MTQRVILTRSRSPAYNLQNTVRCRLLRLLEEIGMQLFVKRFNELSLEELYDILQLRASVFVVEQNCPYLDPDGLDKKALHLFIKDDSGIKACLRVMDRGAESEYVSIGRVVAADRRKGYGTKILAEGIKAAREYFSADCIYLEAQTYAKGLYTKLGFREISGEFLLDGIPHVKMLYEADE